MCNYLVSTPFLYVYTTFKKRRGEGDGVIWVCHRCCYNEAPDGTKSDMVFDDKGDLMVHLHEHQKDNHGVSDELLIQLASEIAQALPEEKESEDKVAVIFVGEPPWEEWVHKPTAVCAFKWDHTMCDCVAQIKKVGERYLLETHWGGKRYMNDGDWVVRSPLGEVWLVDDGKFNRYYTPRRKG
jgi:hypothetical protein